MKDFEVTLRSQFTRFFAYMLLAENKYFFMPAINHHVYSQSPLCMQVVECDVC